MLFCVRQRERKSVCMPLPGKALWGFSYECVTVHVCVYFGEITMGGCVFTLHGKIILLTVWKINDKSSLAGSGEPRRQVHVVHMVAL